MCTPHNNEKHIWKSWLVSTIFYSVGIRMSIIFLLMLCNFYSPIFIHFLIFYYKRKQMWTTISSSLNMYQWEMLAITFNIYCNIFNKCQVIRKTNVKVFVLFYKETYYYKIFILGPLNILLTNQKLPKVDLRDF